MLDANDMDLVREYASRNSEQAFETLVHRHINLVHSVTLRHVRNPAHAEEVTQAVFIILARKAASLRPGTVLGGWLYETARLSSGSFLRGEHRRQRREQEAHMQSTVHESANDSTWEQLAPHLDEAMAALGEKDRNAVVLRFFQNKNTREIADSLGVEESAAQKRVSRAVEKLRSFFTKRGVTLSATAVGGMIAANSVQAAPVGLATTVCATAIKGSAVAASTLTLVKGTIKIMLWTKAKTALVADAAIILATGTTTVIVKRTSGDGNLTPQEIANKSQDAYAALSSYSDSGTTVSEGGGSNSKTTFTTRLSRPNLYRIDWTQTGGSYTENGIVWSEGKGDFMVRGAAGQEKNAKPEKMNNTKQALGICAAVSGQGSCTIAETFFNKDWGDMLGVVALGRSELKKQSDEKVGGVDCYVFSSKIDATKLPDQAKLAAKKIGNLGITTTTLWIGKRDHLIHQIRTSMEGMSIAMPRQSDDNIKTILERQNKPATPEAIAAWRTQMDTMMKQAQGARFVFTQTRENIAVNKKFSKEDFAP